jgi:integrase
MNPCQGIEATKEQARSRALNDKELRKLLRGLPKHLDPQVTDFVLFTLATGARIGEVIDMEWSDIFDDEWRLTDTKNKQEHIVFLSHYVLGVLERQQSDSKFVWPNPATHNGKVRREAASKGLHAALPELGIEEFTPHDLRRTFGAWLGRNEVEERVHDRCLNHVFSGIRAVYNVASYDEKARAAWQQWGEHLQVLSSRNVTTIRGKQAKR